MKKLIALLCGCLLLLPLGGCDGGEDMSDPSGGSTTAQRKLGLGTVSTTTMNGANRTRVKTTVAAVILDTEGRILECELDELDFHVALKDGVPQDVEDLATKEEKGDDYTPTAEDMGESSASAKPWHEQVDAFCEFVEGKTGAEVSALAATDGKSTQVDGCDLILTDFIQAVRHAADSAVAQNLSTGDDLKLALTATRADTSTHQKPQYDVEIAAVTIGNGDRITGCITDTLQAKLTVTDGAFTTVSGGIETKREMGDAYGMKAASGIQREWYEQADAFDTYTRGKTAAELAGLKLGTDGKTDAISGCTVAVSGMLKNVVKAAKDD